MPKISKSTPLDPYVLVLATVFFFGRQTTKLGGGEAVTTGPPTAGANLIACLIRRDLMEDDSMIVHPPTQAVDALDSEPSDQPPANEEGSDGGDELWSVSAIVRSSL